MTFKSQTIAYFFRKSYKANSALGKLQILHQKVIKAEVKFSKRKKKSRYNKTFVLSKTIVKTLSTFLLK